MSAATDLQADDFPRRFGGVGRLYGAAALERFRAAHVCVIGIGGVGSWTVEALARTAIGRLTLIDPDHIAESNVNRQIHALSGELGKAKVQAMAERIAAINAECRVRGIEDFLSADNLPDLIPGAVDHVVDAIDSARVKAALIAHCKRQRLPLVCAGAAGGQTDPAKIRSDDLALTQQDPLLAKTRSLLRRHYGYPRGEGRKFGVTCVYSTEQLRYPEAQGGACYERPPDGGVHGLNCAGFGSSVVITAGFGLMMAGVVLNRLAAR
ncbi:MAG: tRNA threonylcarbamoyladenosine dehydratase [Pseudomonadota bacterium]